MHSIETAYTANGDCSFRTTTHNNVSLTQTDQVEGVSNSVRGSSACRTSCIVGTVKTIHNRNLSGSNIRDHLGDEERIELRTVFFAGQGIVTYLFLECTDTTDTGAKDDTNSV